MHVLLNDSHGGLTSRFVLYMEDEMYQPLSKLDDDLPGRQMIGEHGAKSKHSAAFLDGHAANMFMDTRSWGGTGWTAIDPNWVKQVDYTPPSCYYKSASKNIDPPPNP